MEGYTVNKYDDKGRMTESQHQNMLFVNSPNQILSQKNCMNMINTDTSPASSTNVSSATARRRSGCLTCLYDEYGNRIDGDSLLRI